MSSLPVNTTITVPVSSAWTSKVNWTQAVAAFAMILTLVSGGKVGMSGDQQAALVVSIGVFFNILTWVLKTFFTSTVHASSLTATNIATGTTAKVVAIIAVILASLIFTMPAFAQLKPLPPLKPLTGNLANDLNPAGTPSAVAPGLPGLLIGGQSKEDLIKLWQSIQKASTADLSYAILMATLANSQAPKGITTGAAMRLSCLTAIQTLNGQIGGTGLMDSSTPPKPMVRPDPALFTDAETFAEVIDAVQPGGPLWTSCAGAAQLAATSTVAFVNALVSGAAGLALLAPK